MALVNEFVVRVNDQVASNQNERLDAFNNFLEYHDFSLTVKQILIS